MPSLQCSLFILLHQISHVKISTNPRHKPFIMAMILNRPRCQINIRFRVYLTAFDMKNVLGIYKCDSVHKIV